MLLLAACTNNGNVTAQSSTGPTPSYGVFSGTIQLSGEVSVSGRFTDTFTSRGERCDAYVRGVVPATTIWVVPAPSSGSVVGGHLVSMTAGVPNTQPSTGYHGPGTYVQPSAIVGDLIVDNDSFVSGEGTKTSITVAHDGSGTLSFSGLIDTQTDAIESGNEHWTCAG